MNEFMTRASDMKSATAIRALNEPELKKIVQKMKEFGFKLYEVKRNSRDQASSLDFFRVYPRDDNSVSMYADTVSLEMEGGVKMEPISSHISVVMREWNSFGDVGSTASRKKFFRQMQKRIDNVRMAVEFLEGYAGRNLTIPK